MLISFKINRAVEDLIGKYQLMSSFVFTPISILMSLFNSKKK
jgi:hypothetical protein